MNNRHIAFGVVGLLVGLVLGFFVSEATRDKTAPPQQQAASQAPGQELPEGHPPIDIDQRLQELRKHAEEHDEHVDAKVQIANLLYDVQRFDEAIPWYEKALSQKPGDVNVYNDLATCYFATGNKAKAFELLRKSLEIEADHPVALQNIGWFYFQDNNFEEAIRNWERLIQVHPDFQNIEQVKQQLENAKSHQRGEHS